MEDTSAGGLGGQWIIAIFMIVIVGWLVFRYLVPKGWKEWRAAGILQAFIIALYAEMYGFPLTIYVLTSYFGVDIPWLHMRGHLWSSLLGLGDIGALFEMVLGYAIMFSGILLLAAGWRQIYRGVKEKKMVTDGLYKYVRHPQYTGIFIAVFGQLVHWPTLPSLILAPLVFFMYYRLALKEERQVAEQFGHTYEAYAAVTPRFFPKAGAWRTMFRVANSIDSEREIE